MKRATAFLLAAALAGCSQDPTGTGTNDACYASLSEYCSVWPCPAYEESLAELRQPPQAAACFVAQAGSCGALLFTRFGGGFGNTTRYFDAKGALVAVHATSDAYAMGSACPNWKHYGERLSCREVTREDFCRR
jgi:hypothetical protein